MNKKIAFLVLAVACLLAAVGSYVAANKNFAGTKSNTAAPFLPEDPTAPKSETSDTPYKIYVEGALQSYRSGNIEGAEKLLQEFDRLKRPFDANGGDGEACTQPENLATLERLLTCSRQVSLAEKSWADLAAAKKQAQILLETAKAAELADYLVTCGGTDYAPYELLCWHDSDFTIQGKEMAQKAFENLAKKLTPEIIKSARWEKADVYGPWKEVWIWTSADFNLWPTGEGWKPSAKILGLGLHRNGHVYIVGLPLIEEAN
jgi:hypothetical protein